MQIDPLIDIVIPCHNAQNTLERAIVSALGQKACRRVYAVDDASTDHTFSLLEQMARSSVDRLIVWRRDVNGGPARARNEAVWRSASPFIAFLDADDYYEPLALDPAVVALQTTPSLALIRLALKPVGLPQIYSGHPDYPRAWRQMEMTVAGNLVIRRNVFLAAGGFPEHEFYRRLGGEDGSLGIALHQSLQVGSLFDQPGVIYTYRPGAHAERLLRAHYYGEIAPEILQHTPAAQAVTEGVKTNLRELAFLLEQPAGVAPIRVEWVPAEAIMASH